MSVAMLSITGTDKSRVASPSQKRKCNTRFWKPLPQIRHVVVDVPILGLKHICKLSVDVSCFFGDATKPSPCWNTMYFSYSLMSYLGLLLYTTGR